MAEVGERYIAHRRRQGRKHSTLVAVDSALRIWIVPHLGGRALARITHEDVEDLIAAMEDRGLSPKSIHNYVGTLSALFAFAMGPRREWATANPCAGIELPAVPESTEIKFLELEEVDAVVRAVAPGPYAQIDRVLYRTAAMTGLREGELIALRWRDVDWPAARIRVRWNYVLGEMGTPKSKRSTRSVPMAPVLGGELDRLFQASAWQADDDLVFGDPVGRRVNRQWQPPGGPLDKGAILRRYRIALRAANVDPTHCFHDLRHTFGTWMAAAGVPMRTVQEYMGHRDIKTTERYADYAPNENEARLVALAFARATPLAAALDERPVAPRS